MKCRGFRGRFYLLDHFAFSPRATCRSAPAALLAGRDLVALEWL